MENETLTEHERGILEHLKHAQQLGSSLNAYADAFDVSVKALYNGRAQLVKKGAWPKAAPPGPSVASPAPVEPALIAVQVVEPAPMPPPLAKEALACRLIAPGGWVIEFAATPEARWLAMLLRSAERASS